MNTQQQTVFQTNFEVGVVSKKNAGHWTHYIKLNVGKYFNTGYNEH